MSQLKKLFLVLIAFTLFQWMVKCNSPEKRNSESLTTTKNCHCNDLIYDDLYNHFILMIELFLIVEVAMKNIKVEKLN